MGKGAQKRLKRQIKQENHANTITKIVNYILQPATTTWQSNLNEDMITKTVNYALQQLKT